MKGAKDKKQLRRKRQEELKERAKLIQSRLLASGEEEEVQYVLPADDDIDRTANGTSGGDNPVDGSVSSGVGSNQKDDHDEDRVQLPSVTVNEGARTASSTGRRRRQKMSWEELKIAVAERYGHEMSALVSEHDGNAEDPFFTVYLKSVRRTVPVPRHWSPLPAFMSNQDDRERATDICGPEIALLGVGKVRATRDRKANLDQVAFVKCFITGTPLQSKRFNVALSRFGDIFYEGKWLPRSKYEPGVLSQRLRAALSMGPHSPPPWLYGMQAMRRLPPAYPGLKVPGLNAPIPPGAQWGSGEGQWGQPPRAENNTFLFPGVMDEAAAEDAPPVYWGTVPPLSTNETALAQSDIKQRPSATVTMMTPPPAATLPVNPAPAININPVPFRPQVYTPVAAAQFVPAVPQEYVRVQDGTVGATVALGSVLVPKAAAVSGAVPILPVAPQLQPPTVQPPPLRPTKF
uniref:Putative spliceosome-associated protein n=1 Tax=Trypanosoma vivax (strain Y486) TaxID=1055687 RepID=G0TWL8_TRYVY|nr:putative spliceosome-associated protein [Trypanosoma vivax Y486]